jgi:Ser/Thr protein kinase RdoA (MazF antagonist)
VSLDPHLRSIALAFDIDPESIERIETGLIHKTFVSRGRSSRWPGTRWIVQSVNPIFAKEVQEDIDAVTRHVEAKGLVTPRLLTTREGRLWIEDSGEIWRAMTFIEGVTRNRLGSATEAREAGRTLARFHSAVADLEHEFKARRLGVHDTPKHLANLRNALESEPEHRLFGQVAPLGKDVLSRAEALGALPALPERVVHGDPKINNLLFDPKSGVGVALVDLDTVARMPLPIELGDAFRSWCNPSGEDATKVSFDLELFEQAIAGYRGGLEIEIGHVEREAIPRAIETIMLELAARFLADALFERYFGFDTKRFKTRGDHNLVRGEGQLRLARDFADKRSQVEATIRRVFGA